MIEKDKKIKPIELNLRFNEEIEENLIEQDVIKITDIEGKPISYNLRLGEDKSTLVIKLYVEEICLKGYLLEFKKEIYSVNKKKLDTLGKMKFFLEDNDTIENNGNRIVKEGNFIYYSGNKKIYTYLQSNSYSEIWKTNVDGSINIKLSDDFAKGMWIDKEWIYYINYRGEDEDNYLYRIKKDGSLREKITDVGVKDFYVTDKYIFCCKYDYIDIDNNYKIFRIDKNGKNKLDFHNVKGNNIKVSGPFLYYVNIEDGYSIYRVRLDGVENTKLNNISSKMYMELYKEWIYFINEEYDYNLYRMLKDGSYIEQLNNQVCRQVIIHKDKLYYYSLEKEEKAAIYKMNLDGEKIERILETDGLTQIYIKGKNIYYIKDQQKGIYSINLDSLDNKLLKKVNAVSIDVVGEYIYYYNLNTKDLSMNLFRMKTDGSNNEIIE
ncbi:DUF5050 domain-containing protein [Clostridium oceanicum]|uniref:DUF5050 domain-containing protein n=1 Tax=Clostridium oceanicum TaxID=1543 RepID=A0ABP3V5E7_9CLOT